MTTSATNSDQQPRVHIVDMNASLLSMTAAAALQANDTAVSSLTDMQLPETATVASESNGTEVSSVALLRGWLDDFGKQQKQHFQKNKHKEEVVPEQKEHSPVPMPPSQVRQLKGKWSSKVATASRTNKATHTAPAPRVVIQHSTPKKIELEKVQATNDGYASVKELSAWLASDPTNSTTMMRKKILKGRNIEAKSAVFAGSAAPSSTVATMQQPTVAAAAPSKNHRRMSLSTMPVAATTHVASRRASMAPRESTMDTWETSSLIGDGKTSEATGLDVLGRAMTEIGVSSSGSDDAAEISSRAKNMWRQKTPPRPMAAPRRYSMALALPTKNQHATVTDRGRLPFNSPALKKKLVVNVAAATCDNISLKERSDGAPMVDMESSDQYDNVIEINSSELHVPQADVQETFRRPFTRSVLQKPVTLFGTADDAQPFKPAKRTVDDGEQTLKTCSLTAEEPTEVSIDPPIVMASSTLSSWPDTDMSYQLTDSETAAIANGIAADCGSFNLDMIVSSHQLSEYESYTSSASDSQQVATKQEGNIAKNGMHSCPQLPSVTLDISKLRNTLKPRSDRKEKKDDESDMGPVGFHAARASFLAKINPPPKPDPEQEEDECEEDLNKPIDFRKARALLVKRSKQNGNDVEVLNKVTRRKAKFEGMIGQQRRRASVGSTDGLSRELLLHRASWQPVDKPGKFEKVFVGAEVAPKKTLDDLP
ncbi:hypothetical protein MPSEU_000988200 [Mayamaea pseudoterrestris]|nr:hypothetical protein MPSEU_000988200 [Mayamaea pseudoterrestris]